MLLTIRKKEKRKRESPPKCFTIYVYSFFLQVGRCIVLQKKKGIEGENRKTREISIDGSMGPIEANLEYPAPPVFAAPIAFEHVRLLTESVGPPCQRACTGSSIISAESVSSFLKQKRANDDENEVPSMDEGRKGS